MILFTSQSSGTILRFRLWQAAAGSCRMEFVSLPLRSKNVSKGRKKKSVFFSQINKIGRIKRIGCIDEAKSSNAFEWSGAVLSVPVRRGELIRSVCRSIDAPSTNRIVSISYANDYLETRDQRSKAEERSTVSPRSYSTSWNSIFHSTSSLLSSSRSSAFPLSSFPRRCDRDVKIGASTISLFSIYPVRYYSGIIS